MNWNLTTEAGAGAAVQIRAKSISGDVKVG